MKELPAAKTARDRAKPCVPAAEDSRIAAAVRTPTQAAKQTRRLSEGAEGFRRVNYWDAPRQGATRRAQSRAHAHARTRTRPNTKDGLRSHHRFQCVRAR